MIRRLGACVGVLAFSVSAAMAGNEGNAGEPGRGELLYSTNCLECHTERIHWRDKRLARDWESLVAEVGRWQSVLGLGWGDEEIGAVARYLNALHYGYTVPERKL
jgi:mono/diheme cytochrome c family protein